MSRVKGRDTGLERVVRSALHRTGLRFRKHVRDLPGRPDIVFPGVKLAVFLDGDFWHGYRFPLWKRTLPAFWRRKISRNRERDQQNFRRLRRSGWQVLRLWQHEVRRDHRLAVERILEAARDRQKGRGS
jgi:DNA mismatch endonuclease (patch repair protein)